MSAAQVVGWIGAAVAGLFFGSNYVPTKNYPQGDGMAFVWFFSSGVMTVGIFSIFFATHVEDTTVFVYTGLIGGALWTTGNMCVIPIIKCIGLGLGMLVWGSTSIVTGFFVGKFGLFGVDEDHVTHNAINWVGAAFIVGAMIIFFFVKPTLEADEASAPLLGAVEGKAQIQEAKSESLWDRIPARTKPVIGLGLAVASGMLYGVNMVPMKLWAQNHPNAGHVDFVLCHFTGIFLYSTAVFLIYLSYCAIVGRTPQVFPQSILPAYLSGFMWGIAQCGLMVATGVLGFTVGFPIGSAGPLIVSSLWSVLYFREIRGTSNLMFLAISFVFIGVGMALLVVSQG